MSKPHWDFIASRLSLGEVKEKILTGYEGDHRVWVAADYGYLKDFKQLQFGSVLDFGCGLGRNFEFLRKLFDRVDGYDLPSMIDRLKSEEPEAIRYADLVSADWSDLRGNRYDLVFAVRVFQHIFEDELVSYLRDISLMSLYLWVETRSFNDDHGKNNVKIMLDSGLFEAEYVSVWRGDVLDAEWMRAGIGEPGDIEELARDGSEFHCRILFRSKVYSEREDPSRPGSAGEKSEEPGDKDRPAERGSSTGVADSASFDERELMHNLVLANLSCDRSVPGPAVSGRRVTGRVVTLLKRIVRRMIYWYVDPVIDNQSYFNESITRSVNELKRYADTLRADGEGAGRDVRLEIERIKAELEAINKRLEKMAPGSGDEHGRVSGGEEHPGE